MQECGGAVGAGVWRCGRCRSVQVCTYRADPQKERHSQPSHTGGELKYSTEGRSHNMASEEAWGSGGRGTWCLLTSSLSARSGEVR